MLVGGALVVVLFVFVGLRQFQRKPASEAPRGDRADRSFPAPRPVALDEPVFEDFLGSEACAACHQEQYNRWKGSTHGTRLRTEISRSLN